MIEKGGRIYREFKECLLAHAIIGAHVAHTLNVYKKILVSMW